MKTIDLNSDLGELPAQRAVDLELMTIISSANIACGGHAGDEESMREMVAAAHELGIAIGAHPSYPDRAGFGRKPCSMSLNELQESICTQIHSLGTAAAFAGCRLTHVKPHGALYHAAMHKPDVADAIGRAMLEAAEDGLACENLALVGIGGTLGMERWRSNGMRIVAEAFADRVYAPDGTLMPRDKPGALIDDPHQAASQALEITERRRARAANGSWIRVDAETICIHSDTPGAVAVARAVRSALEKAGFAVKAGWGDAS